MAGGLARAGDDDDTTTMDSGDDDDDDGTGEKMLVPIELML